MVKIMEYPIEMDDLGVKPTIFGNIRLENKATCDQLVLFWASSTTARPWISNLFLGRWIPYL